MGLVLAAVLVLAQEAATLAPLAPLDPRWRVALDAAPAAAPALDERTAYVALRDGTLAAIDLDTGLPRWRVAAATSLAPATGGGLVFAAVAGDIAAFDAESGRAMWRVPLPGGAAAPLYWDTGWLVASTPDGDLAAFRAEDGELVWRQKLGAALAAEPAPALDRLYLGLADGRLVCVLLATGEPVWTRTLAGRVTALLALEDQLVAATAARDVLSVDLRRGRDRWTWRVGGDVSGVPAADDRRVFFAARDNVLRAVDRRSGNLRWKASLPTRPSSGPLVLGRLVLAPLVGTAVAGFEAATGASAIALTAAGELAAPPLVRRASRETAPRLIVASRDGTLQGFGHRFESPPAALAELPGSPAVP